MGMSSWIMDLEEQFWDECEDIIKESESVHEAVGNCVKYANDNWFNFVTEYEIEMTVYAMWEEIWGKYN